MFDEFNRPNPVMRSLLGVDQTELVMPPEQQVAFIKQDLNFVAPIGEVTMGNNRISAFGIISKVKASAGAQVTSTFADKSPAVVERGIEKGRTLYCAFLPSLSYFKPAIPIKPLDRGTSDDAMSHYLPTQFDKTAGALIGALMTDIRRPVVASAERVETSLIESSAGTALLVTNWSGKPIAGLKLTVDIAVPAKQVSLASGGAIQMAKEGDRTVLTFDLEIADTVILR